MYFKKYSLTLQHKYRLYDVIMEKKKVLLIVTGGTISMVQDPKTGALRPADVDIFKQSISEMDTETYEVDIYAFDSMVDSSDVHPTNWTEMATVIYEHYEQYDGFVVLHGTDTMAYSASALSFMLENLAKPVVFTGSQIPMGVLRSDAKTNLLTAIEIAAAQDEEGYAIVPEVCICFEDKVYRGNRTTKKNAEHFGAFNSYNYPALAQIGVHIKYKQHLIHYGDLRKKLRLRTKIDQNVVILKLFPGISQQTVETILHIPGLRAVILETYGAGNAPTVDWLYNALFEAISRDIIIVNKTQCNTGFVAMGQYETSLNLLNAGVLSGYDITTEALLAKLMYLLGELGEDIDKVRELLATDICGEMTIDN